MRRLFGVPVETLAAVLTICLAVALGAVAILAVRNRIFVKLGIRNMTRRRGRTAIIVVGLMLGTAIVASAFVTGDTMASTIRSSVITSLGFTDESVSARTADDATAVGQATGQRYLRADEAAKVLAAADAVPTVDGAAPAIIEPIAIQDVVSRQNESRVTLFAADADRLGSFGTIRDAKTGRPVSLNDLRSSEVFLNTDAADALDAEPGHSVVVFAAGRPHTLTVRGIVRAEGTGTDGAAALVPLSSGQQLLIVGDNVQQVLISNRGGEVSGSARTEEVTKALNPVVIPLGLQVHPVKHDGLDLADKQGNAFLSMFTTFGTFTIAAGILLIFLIFVMLAAERRSEMGTARAVGTQRHHLIEMSLFEGVAYDLLAAAVGAVLGLLIAFGMVQVLSGALASSGLDVRYSVRTRSLVLAYAIGVLLTFVVVTASAWRVSRLNVVTAIRNLPEPPKPHRTRARWALGLVGVAFGALMAASGASGHQASAFIGGVAIALASLVPVTRAAGLSERTAYTIGGGLLMVWCLLPFSTYERLVPDLKMDFSVWVLVGLLMVIGATWLVVFNATAFMGLLTKTFGRIPTLAPVLKTSIAEPLRNRFRTATTVALFTLVVFTLVVGSTTSNAFMSAANDQHSFGGGFQIRAETAPMSPIVDMWSSLHQAGAVDTSAFTAYAGQSYLPTEARQGTSSNFETYPVRGLDDAFTRQTTYGFAARARGFETDSQVWDALASGQNYAVVDSTVAPHRTNWGFGVFPKFKLQGFYVEDKVFNPVEIQVRDPQTSTTVTLKVIGVLKDTVPLTMAGISTSQRDLAPFGNAAAPSVWFFQTRSGVDSTAVAKQLEAAFLANGMQAKAMKDLLHDAVKASLTFQWLILGFLGLGLVIGVAALGVISARSVVERRQQIGVLRAIGFQRGMVQLSFLLESLFVTVVGIVVGTALGLITGYNVIADSQRQPSWDNLHFSPPWVALVIIMTTVLLASIATTLAPARRASKVYPAAALRYQ
jgi:putative ABC transport system permease protein